LQPVVVVLPRVKLGLSLPPLAFFRASATR
jgi:hypothetical protein